MFDLVIWLKWLLQKSDRTPVLLQRKSRSVYEKGRLQKLTSTGLTETKKEQKHRKVADEKNSGVSQDEEGLSADETFDEREECEDSKWSDSDWDNAVDTLSVKMEDGGDDDIQANNSSEEKK